MIARWFRVVTFLMLAMTSYCHAEDHAGVDQTEVNDPFDKSGEEAILAAIAKGDLVELKKLETVLNRTAISNLNEYAWRSPNPDVIVYLRYQKKVVASDLQIAVVRGDLKAVQALLKPLEGVEPRPGSDFERELNAAFGHSVMFSSHTPLRLAIRRGHTEVVRALIAAGANVNERLFDARRVRNPNEFPIGEAIQLGNVEIVQALVDGQATLDEPAVRYVQKDQRVNLSEFYKTHLNSRRSVVQNKLKEMFAAGLLVEERDPDANVVCPLILAIQSGRSKLVSIILNGGANPNVLIGGERRPLHDATQKGNPEIVRLLVEKGADVNAPTADGKLTPLKMALGYQHGDIVEMLRAAGAK